MLLPTSKVCLLKMKWKSPSLIFQILDIPFRDWIHYAIKEVSNLPKTWFFSLPVFDDGFNNRRPKLFLKYIHQLIKILPSSALIFFDIFLPLKKVRKKNYEKLQKLRNFWPRLLRRCGPTSDYLLFWRFAFPDTHLLLRLIIDTSHFHCEIEVECSGW